ncbi:hypothetical protein CC78DRAFT_577041 [Lojkania enalia]|uniref:Uncharacterized protein n=1 Tax=Lojkania enalia TaxID=147567 RepID=A0A9P4KFC9_9PLEO|nr:hypothetical protein CC78DRAFT_577041 [Didymosphaeria enalia]
MCPSWIEPLTDAFGGDSSNVTSFGESAGAAPSSCASLTKSLSRSEAVEVVFNAYDITLSTLDDGAMKNLIEYITDLGYVCPALALTRAWSGKAYYYNFNEANPWNDLCKGFSMHMLDAAFLFQNYNKKPTPKAREAGVQLGKDLIKFTGGIAPWQKSDEEKVFVRLPGPSEEMVASTVGGSGWRNGRRHIIFKPQQEGKVDLDGLRMAWD